MCLTGFLSVQVGVGRQGTHATDDELMSVMAPVHSQYFVAPSCDTPMGALATALGSGVWTGTFLRCRAQVAR